MAVSQGCQLFGVDQALAGIKDAVILYHTVIGCSFATSNFQMATNMLPSRRTCSVFSEKEVVFGGEENLEKAIERINELYDYSLLIVISGCVSEIIGDDVASVIDRFRRPGREIIHLNGAGFKGTYDRGFESGLLALRDLMEPGEPRERDLINIIGLEADAYLRSGDMKAIRDIVGPDFEVNFLGSDCLYQDVKTAPSARLNLVVDRGLDLARAMEEDFSLPYRVINYPYGLLGAFRILDTLSEFFGLDYGQRKADFRDQLLGGVEKVYGYLQNLYQVPVAIIGGRSRVEGMKIFLEEELGMEALQVTYKEDIDLLEDFYDEIIGSDVTFLFGSSFDKDFALRNNLIYMPFDYPVFDRMDLTERTYVGPRGSLQLIEDILNQIHMSKVKRGALYQ